MRFVTVMDELQALKFIDNLKIDNNLLFDFPPFVLEDVKCKLESLTGSDNTPVVGIVISDDGEDLSKTWNSICNVLPIKSGDVIFQFRIDSDEMMYGNFNQVMGLLYSGSTCLDVFDYNAPNKETCLGIVSEVSINSFDYAYIVGDSWDKDSFSSPSVNVTNVSQLKDLCRSKVWGS